MSSRLFLLLSIILAIIQGTLLPLVFAEGLLLIFYLWSNNFDKNLVWPFLAGLIFDLVQDQHLGTTSLIFLIIAWGLKYLRGSFPLHRPIILSILAAVVVLARSYVLIGNVGFWAIILSFIICHLSFSVVWGGRREIRVG